MVIASEKPIEEIIEPLKEFKRVLNIGCAGCTAICLAGGQKEVDVLNARLKAAFKELHTDVRIEGYTIERQCDRVFIDELDHFKDKYDCFLSMACGAGVQLVAERFPDKPVYPALNTVFVGVNREIGWYEEKCRNCGDCQLAYTGGICPVTRCAKSIFNGPCGGTQAGGFCEVDKTIPCAWCDIFNRLKEQHRLAQINKIKKPMQWKNQIQGTLIHEAYKDRYAR